MFSSTICTKYTIKKNSRLLLQKRTTQKVSLCSNLCQKERIADFETCAWPSEKFKKIGVMLDHVDRLVPSQLPADVRQYVRLDVLSVHPGYTR